MAVIGATGEVGGGIVTALLARGHRVIAVARNPARLAALVGRHAAALLHPLQGSFETDEAAEQARDAILAMAPVLYAAILSVNGERVQLDTLSQTTQAYAALLAADLLTHFTAARALLPALAKGGVLLGIGGGSADFILDRGTHMSVAQAGLRMLYRGLAHEHPAANIRELLVASVVNSPATSAAVHPSWPTDLEIGAHVAAIIEDPEAFPGPILRMSRRGPDGLPALSADPPTRVQGLRQLTVA